MFIGHFGVGFASKRFASRVPLVLLLVAALFPDILVPVFSLLGWEHDADVKRHGLIAAPDLVHF